MAKTAVVEGVRAHAVNHDNTEGFLNEGHACQIFNWIAARDERKTPPGAFDLA